MGTTDRKEVNFLSCYHPIHAFRNTVYGDIEFDERKCHGYEWLPIDFPCGRCLGCRIEKSKEWSIRCQLESDKWQENYFITLTYDDLHVPIENFVDHTGELVEDTPLVRSDFTLFFKRLRSYFRDNFSFDGIRVFYCGEYGSLNGRPHYHFIAFNLPLRKFNLIDDSFIAGGYPYYVCPFLDNLWSFGFHQVNDYSFESACYVARYTLKKLSPDGLPFYLPQPFIGMSRRPGIGIDSSSVEDLFKRDYVSYYDGGAVRKSGFTKAMKRKFKELHPEEYAHLSDDLQSKKFELDFQLDEQTDLLRHSRNENAERKLYSFLQHSLDKRS